MVQVTTLKETLPAILMDISSTGIRVRGSALPAVGVELFVNLDGLVTFGSVVRAEGDERGIAFESPLEPKDERILRHKVTLASGLPPEVKAAYEDWSLGIAR